MIQDVLPSKKLIYQNQPRKFEQKLTSPIILENNHGLSCQKLYQQMNLNYMPTVEQMALKIGKIFGEMIESNAHKSHEASVFDSKKKPSISVIDYFSRFAKYSRCSLESFIIAMILIDRYIDRNGKLIIHSNNSHRLFFGAIVVSLKTHDDLRLSNEDLAKIGGISLPELEILEWEILSALEFNVQVELEEYVSYLSSFLF